MFSVCPLAGLGNRMRVVASVYNKCLQHNIPMRLVWLREPGFNASWSDLFANITPPSLVLNDHSIFNYFIYSKPSWKNLFISKIIDRLSNRKIVYELYKDSLNLDLMKENTIISSYSQQGELYPLSELFKPQKAILAKIDEIKSKFSANTIGVHIRRTDNTQAKSASTIEKFDNEISSQIAKDGSSKFFLCSDDIAVKQYFIEKYGEHIIVFNAKLSRNSPKGIKDAVVELWTLASTKEIWGSYYSSYTDMASAIFGAPLKIIK